jgi:uncharacterized membrane protein
MLLLATLAMLWIGLHKLVPGGPGRAWLVQRVGDNAYRALFGALSVAMLIALGWAYAHAGQPPRTPPGAALGGLVAAVHVLASLLVVTGLSTANPTTAGFEATVRRPDVVRGALRITRHPFLWGVVLWAAAHLLVRHDPASLLLFGSVGYVALSGTFSIDAKRAVRSQTSWPEFAAATSNLPFAAIAQGRQHLALAEIGVVRLSVAVAVWGLAMWLHP